ncbi:MAG: membrane protein insertase YidC [Deltaproteobacteria bacterium]|nr:membrane protein insertase YidC [Myxococcales bacterium]MDP3215449.1 membrane protein insertase YidC [Deltaproteobacteria bacterium]
MKENLRLFALLLLGGVAVWFFTQKSNTRPTPSLRNVPPPPAETARPPEQTFRVRSPLTGEPARSGFDAEVTTRSGGLRSLRLNGRQFAMRQAPADPRTGARGSDHRMNLASTWNEDLLSLRTELTVKRGEETVVPPYVDYTGRQVSEREVELTWQGNDVEVVRTYRSERPFTMDVETRVRNLGAPINVEARVPVYEWVLREDENGKFFQRPWQVVEGTCRHGTELYREARDKLLERRPEDALPGAASFVSLGNTYFELAVVPRGNGEARCRLFADDRIAAPGQEPLGSVYGASIGWARASLATGETQRYQATVYLGPKEPELLAAVTDDHRLTDTVNLGFFSFIARQLLRFLRFLHGIVGNWGAAIMLLTLCIRVALLPLLAKSMKSMAMMAKLKPELDEINKRLADNQEAKTLATMELYRKHGVNPLSGCFPQLAQLPIWWALYTTLQTSVELFHAPFIFWWRDLSAPDPYYVLPLVLGVIMFLQQKLMPPQGMDPVQAKMMTYFFPIFLTGISLFLPSGLALYMLVNSCLGVLQQWYTKQQMDQYKGGTGTGGGSAIQVKTLTGDKP